MMTMDMTQPKTSYYGVSNSGETGKLSFTSMGLIFYPGGGQAEKKVKMGWGSVASERFDSSSLSFQVYHIKGQTHNFQMKDSQDYWRIEQDFASRLEAYYEYQRQRHSPPTTTATTAAAATSPFLRNEPEELVATQDSKVTMMVDDSFTSQAYDESLNNYHSPNDKNNNNHTYYPNHVRRSSKNNHRVEAHNMETLPEVYPEHEQQPMLLVENGIIKPDSNEGNHEFKDEVVVDDSEEEVAKPLLPEGFEMVDLDSDIYSLIMTGSVRGPGFWFALAICAFQTVIVVLVLQETLDWENLKENNPLKIPPGNDLAVTIAQGMLMFILPQVSDDMMQGLEVLIDGYHSEVLDVCPDAKMWKWALAGFLHFAVGTIMIFDVFVLLMQQTTVVNLGLKYCAFGFFSQIDNVAFTIGKKGVCSVPLKKEIDDVEKVQIRKNQNYTWMRRIRDTTLTAILMVGWGIVTHQQLSGRFICHDIFVQFGDIFNPGIVEFSGVFHMLGINNKHDRRVTYEEQSTGKLRLGYCQEMKRWTITEYRDGAFVPCGNETVSVLGRSGVDRGYSVMAIKDTWQVNATVNGEGYHPFTHVYMACYSCVCGPNGRCEDGRCICNEGYYGVNCEFASPCSTMTLNRKKKAFPPLGFGLTVFPTTFERLKMEDGSEGRNGSLQVEYRPVYYGEHGSNQFLMFFAGRRWIITSTMVGLSFFIDKTSVVDYMSAPGFNIIDSKFEPYFASSVMDVGTPSNQATPARLPWFYVRKNGYFDDDGGWWEVAEEEPTGTSFNCAICDEDTNPCENDGFCEESNNTCSCGPGFEGSLCEREAQCTDPLKEDAEQQRGCEIETATCEASGRCICPIGFIGARCQLPLSCDVMVDFAPGLESGCFQNASCVAETGTCSCPDSFSGSLCQFPLGSVPNETQAFWDLLYGE